MIRSLIRILIRSLIRSLFPKWNSAIVEDSRIKRTSIVFAWIPHLHNVVRDLDEGEEIGRESNIFKIGDFLLWRVRIGGNGSSKIA